MWVSNLTTVTGVRRLAAIVVADVVGYSRLMGANEEATLDALQILHASIIEPLIAEHSGHLFKSTGDGLLIEFTSVVEALRCSMKIQNGLAEQALKQPPSERVCFRIGINLGDVIIQDGDVFGDGVNVAARLEQLAPPGGICISDDVYRHVAGKVRTKFTSGGKKRLKNIDRPLQVYYVSPEDSASSAKESIFATSDGWHWKVSAIAAAIILCFLIAALAWFFRNGAPSDGQADVASKPHSSLRLPIVAVLPFENQTGDPKQDYFADGFTDELIGALGRFNTLRVIARNATRSLKSNTTTDASALSADLGATYFVEGGVRKSGEHMRVSARLTDAQTATVLWSQRFDGTISDIFYLQDDISRRIAGTLAAGIIQLEAKKSTHRPVPQQGAYDLALQARAAGSETSSLENRRIRNLLTKAIEIDPGYAGAYSLLAEALYARVALGWTEFPSRDVQQAEKLARKAIELAPDEPDGHRALGRVHLLLSEYDQAQQALQRAIEINPSDANALAASGAAKLFSGQAKDATKVLSLALKYDPTIGPIYINDLALAYYLAGDTSLALQTSERGISQYPDYSRFHIVAAAASAGLGQKERAKRHVREIRKRIPFLTLKDVGSRFKNAKQISELRKGLSLAGF